MKVVLLVSSILFFLLLASAAYQENFRGEWRDIQRTYKNLLVTSADDDDAKRAAQSFKVEHKQIYLAEFAAIDRCATCHLGVENPAMAAAELPFRKHSGDLLVQHPTEKFGCTICHQGQGRAISKDAAHGWRDDGTHVENIESPLLRGEAVYTSCGKCHSEIDLYGGQADLFASGISGNASDHHRPFIDESSLMRSLHGADSVTAGKKLVVESGCLGCHKYRGRGGILGPDITYVGDKTKHDFDFSRVKGEHNVEQWLFEHFKLPQEIAPETLMPDMGLSDEAAGNLTAYMMSLHRKAAIARYTPLPRPTDPTPASGKTLYGMYCSACHGKTGERSEVPGLVTPSLSNPDTLAVASDDYFRYIIGHGRSGSHMPVWHEEAGGLKAEEISRIVQHLRNWQEPGPPLKEVVASRGDANEGAKLYGLHCASCHGEDGEGGIGTALNVSSLLSIASDDFLRRSIVHGRANTAMPMWRTFSSEQVSDLLAFIRSWHEPQSTLEETLALVVPREKRGRPASMPTDSAPSQAAEAYHANCAGCHGDRGEGGIGTMLNSQEFLALADEKYLYHAIVDGRPGTAMPAWKHLTNETLAGIISYVKGWQVVPDKSSPAELPQQGDWRLGKILYDESCATCHGAHGEGASSTQLANPAFAKTVTDGMLLDFITGGVSVSPEIRGTEGRQAMPPLGGKDAGNLLKTPGHLYDLIAYVRKLQRDPRPVAPSQTMAGDSTAGQAIYTEKCASCHGSSGEGAIGGSLSNPHFLASADDAFLIASIVLGRENTEMLPAGPNQQSENALTAKQIYDLTAYIRGWQNKPPMAGVPHRYLVVSFEDDPFVEMSIDNGKQLFDENCMYCHGSEGRGTRDLQLLDDCASCHGDDTARLQGTTSPEVLMRHFGPRLNNPEFLAAATDGFLQATIVRGRRGTAMPGFGHENPRGENLDKDSINDIIIYIRSLNRKHDDTPSAEQ